MGTLKKTGLLRKEGQIAILEDPENGNVTGTIRSGEDGIYLEPLGSEDKIKLSYGDVIQINMPGTMGYKPYELDI